VVVLGLRHERLVTGIAYRAAQQRLGHRVRVHNDAGRFGGQVDRGGVNPRNLQQCFFDTPHTGCTRHATNADVMDPGRFCVDLRHVEGLVLVYAWPCSKWLVTEDAS